jgi:hypothetical protein
MPVAWLANPATLGVLAAAGLALTVYLFGTLRIEKRKASPSAEVAEIAALRRRLEGMEARWRESEARAAERAGQMADVPAEPPPPVPVRPGMNLNRRGQALRLYRRGENAAEIARVLAMPAGEVQLLLKMHHLRLEQAAERPDGKGRLNPGTKSADKASSAVKPSRRVGEPT